MKREFIITENNFKGYLRKIPDEFKIGSAYQFPIILPFFVPAIPESYLLLGVKKLCFIAKFDQIQFKEETEEDLSGIFPTDLNKTYYKTYVEFLILMTEDKKDKLDLDEFNEVFGISLHWLNHFLATFSIKTGNIDIKYVTHKHFPTMTIYEYFNPSDWNNRQKIATILNSNESKKYEPVSDSDWNKLVIDSYQQNHSLFPFNTSERLAYKSLFHFKEGSYQDSVIYIQTSIESLLKILFVHYALYQEMEEEKIENILINYKNLIQVHCKIFIEGNWDIVYGNEPLYSYWHKTYELRNKIIHSGYQPNFNESNEAIKIALTLKNYIIKNAKDIGNLKSLINGYYGKDNYCYASKKFGNDSAFMNKEELGAVVVDIQAIINELNGEINNKS